MLGIRFLCEFYFLFVFICNRRFRYALPRPGIFGRTCWVEMSEDRGALLIGGEAGNCLYSGRTAQKNFNIARKGYLYELYGGRGRFYQFLIQFAQDNTIRSGLICNQSLMFFSIS